MSATRWTLRDESPALYERGVTSTARLLVYKDGVARAASSGTYTLTDSAGNVIVTGSTSTDGTDTTAAIASGDTTGKAYSSRWRETWALTVAGSTVTFTRDAWLVRSILRPVVTVEDLLRRHRDIRDLVDGGDTAILDYVAEAWATISADLIKRGKRPNLIMESWALRSLHIYRSLALLFADAATRFNGDSRYGDLASAYEVKADDEWNKNLRFEYDSDEDGNADTKAAGSSVLILTAGNMTGPRTWY